MVRANDAARELLFGLVALQNGLVDQAGLVAAFQAWTLDKSRSLADHMIGLRRLDEERKTVIDAMVALHQKLHGDARKGLASLGIANATREKLVSLADPDIDETMTHVGSAHRETDSDGTISFRAGPRRGQEGRFRVLRPHARGGLGTVDIALDDELNREVALKRILDQHADDPSSRHRFMLEAEITGGLEHPGIVPVYGLGRYADGRPYYAMRFIRGDSLKTTIAEFHENAGTAVDRSLALRRLLKRFLDVCNAVDYAHARGVVHRDLKPANIIVGKYGETLVVDWGLAKALGRDDSGAEERALRPSSGGGSSDTLPGQAIGTPAYMSPEQARGELEAIGPKSDVYSLGVTLYCLIVGKAPFEGGDLAELLQNVQRGDFIPPRRHDPAIDSAVEAIVLKAMALKPDDRYASCRALAEDLERWLADERVHAHREPWTRTLVRRLTRHRTSVTAAAAALLVGMAALAAFAAEKSRTNGVLDRKNGELTESNKKLIDSNEKLSAANDALEVQRRRAQMNLDEAIKAIRKFRDTVAEEPVLKNDPAFEDLRKALLKGPLSFFRGLRERLRDDPDTGHEAAGRLAEAAKELGLLSDEIGDKQDALRSFQECLAVLERSAVGETASLPLRREQAITLGRIADILATTGRPDQAIEAYGRVRTMLQEVIREDPEATLPRDNLASCLKGLAFTLSRVGQQDKALPVYEEALAIRQGLAEADPENPVRKRELALVHNDLGTLFTFTGKSAEALAAYQRAIAVLRPLAAEDPENLTLQRELGGTLFNAGNALKAPLQLDMALETHEQARVVREKLAAASPTNIGYQRDLAASHNNIGLVLNTMGRPDDSLKSFEKALGIREKLARANPTVNEFQRELAATLNSVAARLSEAGKADESREVYERSRRVRSDLARDHPETPDFASDLGGVLNNIALLDLRAKRFAEARELLLEAISWQRKALEANDASDQYRGFLSNHLVAAIKAARGLNLEEEAAQHQRALDDLRAKDPRKKALDARLTAVLNGAAPGNRGEVLALARRAYELKRFTASVRFLTEVMEAAPELAADRRLQLRYDAARAAVLAASGEGKDESTLDATERPAFRRRALDWLHADLTDWRRFMESGPPQARDFVRTSVLYWKESLDLIPVREERALERLPEEERETWRSFWQAVDELLNQLKSPAEPS